MTLLGFIFYMIALACICFIGISLVSLNLLGMIGGVIGTIVCANLGTACYEAS